MTDGSRYRLMLPPPYGVGIIMDPPVVLLAKQLHYNWETVVRVHTHRSRTRTCFTASFAS